MQERDLKIYPKGNSPETPIIIVNCCIWSEISLLLHSDIYAVLAGWMIMGVTTSLTLGGWAALQVELDAVVVVASGRPYPVIRE